MDKINCTMKNKFLLEMQSRGYLSQCTDLDGLDKICNQKSITAYIGLIAQQKAFMWEVFYK